MCGVGAVRVVFSCSLHEHLVCIHSLGGVFPPAPVFLSLLFWFLHFPSKLIDCWLFLCLGRWLNTRFGGYYVRDFSCILPPHAYLPSCIRPHPYLPIHDHSWPPLPSPIPCMTYREFSRPCTHKTYISAPARTPKYPFWLLYHSNTPLRTPIHPYAPISTHNYTPIHHMKNMYKLMNFITKNN